ncbi:TonB-dependent receptor [Terriglobus albidus]|uniref:TonB-dependent receptor n=1 Tax=Terriglobus albidus TaxID=1592106 RepID=A0A5B9EIS3_9BACT|nr:TonB-dependent receptor [Terriglobus albidus]QEE30301.1 TonB-dependent receptor [Terriglobus albidus]
MPFVSQVPSRLRWLVLVVAVLSPASRVLAQAFGEIAGTTTDASRAVVPNVALTLSNEATGTAVRRVSNGAGIFVFPQLNPGRYTLTAISPGFGQQAVKSINVGVSQTAHVDIVLQVSSVTEQVVVAAQSNALDVDNGYKGQIIEQKQIEELPLPTRNPLSLMVLTPGVQTALGNSAANRGGSDSSVASSGYQVNGGVRTNFGGFSEYLVDGVTMTNPRDGTIIALPSAGTVQEFQVQSGAMSAEFGATVGGVINYVTKSGSRTLHGMIFEDYRGTHLNATPALPYGSPKPLNNYNQYGGNIGGPVWIPKIYDGRKRSFFFVDYEGLRWAARSNSTASVPTVLMRQGIFTEITTTVYDPSTGNAAASRTPFAGQKIPSQRFTDFGKTVMALYPMPTTTGVSNNYVTVSKNYQTTDTFTLRGDQYIGQKHRLSLKWTRDEYNSPATSGIGVNDGGTQNVKIPTRNYTASYNYAVTPNILYTAVAGYTWFHRYFADPTDNTIGTQYFGYSVSPALPSGSAVNVRPSASVSLFNSVGTGTPQDRYTTIRELSQILSMTRGRHFLRAGADIRIYKASGLVTSGSPTGAFGFNALQTSNGSSTTGSAFASLLLGLPDTINFDQEPNASAVLTTPAFFLADDWKVTPHFMLNLGFRYQFSTDFLERANSVGWFDPTTINPIVNLPGVMQYANVGGNPRGFTQGDSGQYAPRLGFAYTPAAWDGKIVIRGGIGVYNGPFPIYGFYSSAPGFNAIYNPIKPNSTSPAAALQSTYTLSAPTGPQGASAGLGTALSTIYNRQMNAPRVVQWNFGVQQQMPWKMKFELLYSGNRGQHLLITQNINLPSQSLINTAIAMQQSSGKTGTASAYLNTAVTNPLAGKVPGTLGNATVTRAVASEAFPQFGNVTVLLGNRDSIYHSLQTTLDRRFSKNLTFLAAYTFSKLITNSTPGSFASQSNTGTFQNPYDLRDARAVSAFDSTHTFSITGLYTLPFGRGQSYLTHGFFSALLGGFQLTAIERSVSGVPVAVTQATSNGLGVGGARPDKIGDPTANRHTNTNGSRQWINPAAYAIADGHFGNSPIRDARLRGPMFNNVDMGLQRFFPIWREAQLQFRAEAFNALNHTNLAMPNSDASSTSFGQITSSYDPRNFQFSLHVSF